MLSTSVESQRALSRQSEADERAIRLDVISTLMRLTSPRSMDDRTLADYVRATFTTPLSLLTEACSQLSESWSAEEFGAPRPGDIVKRARKIRGEQIEAQQTADRGHEWDRLKEQRLTPEVARQELHRIASIDLPDTNPTDKSLERRSELARRASLRRIAEFDPNPAEDAEYRRLRDPIDEARGVVPGFRSAASAAKGVA